MDGQHTELCGVFCREDALLEQQPEELPNLEGMMQLDTADLDLPKLPTKFRKPKRPQPGKIQQNAAR